MRLSSLVAATLATAAQAVDVQVVYVGQNPASNTTGAKFWPESIKAEPGSMVQFQFWAGNHTVTQSSFDNPCTPLEAPANATGASGIKSGFQPVDMSMPDGQIPTYTVWINDTSPLWFYCGQGTHCQGGMVMGININESSEKTLDAYKTAAAAVSTGGDAGSGSGDSGSGSDNNTSGDADNIGDPPGSGASGLASSSTILLLFGAAVALYSGV